MKKFIYSAMALAFSVTAFAGNNVPTTPEIVKIADITIKPSELPASLQMLITQYFGGMSNVKKVTASRTVLKIATYDATTIEIYINDGSIKHIKSKTRPIAFTLLAGLPGEIFSLVSTKFQGWTLLEVEAKSSRYELELRNGKQKVKLKFDKAGFCYYAKYTK